MPGELDLVAVGVGPLSLRIDAFNLVSVFEDPTSSTLWLIKSEVALEEGTVGIEPFATYELSVFEDADILLTCFGENVCSLSIFLSIGPFA